MLEDTQKGILGEKLVREEGRAQRYVTGHSSGKLPDTTIVTGSENYPPIQSPQLEPDRREKEGV